MTGNVRRVIEAGSRRQPVRGTSCTSGSRVILHTSSEHLTIEVVGELDGRIARELLSVLLPALRGGNRTVHLDLARLVFVGKDGTDALRKAREAADERGGQILLLHPTAAVRTALEAAGLHVHPA